MPGFTQPRLAGRAIRMLCAVLALVSICPRGHAQAALLMEEPYGVSGALNPTGHEAIYLARICAATPVKLRRCAPGETGVVIARYKGIAGYDWIAIPLIPYLYAVEDAGQVPRQAGRELVTELRRSYRDAHLLDVTRDVPESGFRDRGWDQLVGSSYDRGIYVFRFATSREQDDELIARLNAEPNRSHFNLVRNNCADFAAGILDFYFPHAFHRRMVPDARITTPRQNAWELVRYARSHPEIQLAVYKIAQIRGDRRPSRVNKSVAESLIAGGEVIPVAVLSPVAGGVVCADALVWGRYPLKLKHAKALAPWELAVLWSKTTAMQSERAEEAWAQTEAQADRPMPQRHGLSDQ